MTGAFNESESFGLHNRTNIPTELLFGAVPMFFARSFLSFRLAFNRFGSNAVALLNNLSQYESSSSGAEHSFCLDESKTAIRRLRMKSFFFLLSNRAKRDRKLGRTEFALHFVRCECGTVV